MILFENVTKEFPNGTVALHEVSFHVEPGEFVFIVGPSGAGKTTVLRLMLRELEPTQGEIQIEGQDLLSLKKKKLPELRRQIGAVFQDYKLIEDQTVEENVSLISEMIKPSKEEVEEHVNQILNQVSLSEKGQLFPSQLSGGELQRTAIARALATQPKILFADEPTGNLDPATAWEVMNVLVEVNKAGTTVVVATHNQEFVNALNKRTVELKEGRIVKDTKKPKVEKPMSDAEPKGKKVEAKKKNQKTKEPDDLKDQQIAEKKKDENRKVGEKEKQEK